VTYSDIAFPAPVDITGKKDKQSAVANKIEKSAHVLSSLTQNENGDISYEVKELTPADIGAQPAGNYQPAGDYQPAGNYKTVQTAVEDKITNAAHVLDSLTQNANGEITYTVKELTPADIGA
jgi:hypothetical protein